MQTIDSLTARARYYRSIARLTPRAPRIDSGDRTYSRSGGFTDISHLEAGDRVIIRLVSLGRPEVTVSGALHTIRGLPALSRGGDLFLGPIMIRDDWGYANTDILSIDMPSAASKKGK